MNESGTGAAFNERTAAASLVTTGGIYCGVLSIALLTPTDPFRTIGLLIGGVIVQIILLTIMHIWFAMTTRSEPNDERDTLIKLRSLRLSSVILMIGAVIAMLLLLLDQAAIHIADTVVGPVPIEFLTSPLAIAHALLFVLVAAEVVRSASIVIAYRRGA